MADKQETMNKENEGSLSVLSEKQTTDLDNEQQTFIIQCDEINKRSLGKAIVKFCGNEGTENDQNKAVLRRLLQAAISHVELEATHKWRNAEVKIYDDNFDVYSLRAGQYGHRVFMVSMDENDEPKVVKAKQKRVNAGARSHNSCLVL